MKRKLSLWMITLLVLCYACNNSDTQPKPVQEKTETTSLQPADPNVKSDIQPQATQPSKVSAQPAPESIIGRWQSTTDPQEEWAFADNYLTIYYEGKSMNEVKYGINDKCADGVTPIAEAEKYLSTYDGICYYIVKLDASNMELSVVGRGETLSFKKIK